jgi:hypothetical protein
VVDELDGACDGVREPDVLQGALGLPPRAGVFRAREGAAAPGWQPRPGRAGCVLAGPKAGRRYVEIGL